MKSTTSIFLMSVMIICCLTKQAQASYAKAEIGKLTLQISGGLAAKPLDFHSKKIAIADDEYDIADKEIFDYNEELQEIYDPRVAYAYSPDYAEAGVDTLHLQKSSGLENYFTVETNLLSRAADNDNKSHIAGSQAEFRIVFNTIELQEQGMSGDISIKWVFENTVLEAVGLAVANIDVQVGTLELGGHSFTKTFNAGDPIAIDFWSYTTIPTTPLAMYEVKITTYARVDVPEPATLLLLGVGGLIITKQDTSIWRRGQ